jgi:Arc/MetJ-type ribon-helix-helix transcriptional regulator
MVRRASTLAKKSLVVEPVELDRLVRLGGYRNESEAVRAAVAELLAIRGMQAAIARIRRRATFGAKLK